MLLVKIFRSLNRMRVRYLVAGGVASILYGNPRFTKDLDLFVDMAEDNLKKLVRVFERLKFIPRIPVKAEEFISERNRSKWMREKGMLAFTFINPKNPFENVDILLASPIPFERAYRKKKFFKSGSVRIPAVSKKKQTPLMVTEEALEDFHALSSAQRLAWLDQMRAFLSRTLPAKIKRGWKATSH